MEGGLIGDRALEDRAAVALTAEAEAVKPGGPAVVEVPLEADLVPSRFVVIGVHSSAHLLLSAGGVIGLPA